MVNVQCSMVKMRNNVILLLLLVSQSMVGQNADLPTVSTPTDGQQQENLHGSSLNADFAQAVSRFRNCVQTTANVTRKQHKPSLTRDIMTTGGAFIMRPDMVSISTNEGQDRLVMQGTKLTMTVDGREHTTDSKRNPQYTTFQKVVTSIINGDTTDIANLPDVTISKTGSSLSITIAPTTDKARKQKKMLFSRFVLVLDIQTSVVKLLRLVELDGGFIDYEFSRFIFE